MGLQWATLLVILSRHCNVKVQQDFLPVKSTEFAGKMPPCC